MKKWYFSFGIGQVMHNYVVVIGGEFCEAREKMIEVFGNKWCAQYSEQEWEEYERRWGSLKRIEL